MTTKWADRKRRYGRGEIRDILRHEEITARDDFSFLCALAVQPQVVPLPESGKHTLGNLRTISIPVVETEDYPTGIYFETGDSPVIVLNTKETITDYDTISDLHPVKDSDAYLWLDQPWEEPTDDDLGIYGEWYRREVYKDGMRPYDNKTLGWEDQPPKSYEEDE